METMKIKITKNIKEANCITHSGTFHCDEVFSTVLFSKILPEVVVCRVPDASEATKEQYVYDIGGGEFDHHQFGGNGERENGVKYSSCGLVWKKFGKDIIKKYTKENIDEIWKKMDKELFQTIDAGDNGQAPIIEVDYKLMQISSIISYFNPNWDENTDPDTRFIDAVNLANIVFENTIKRNISKVKAKDMVEDAINNSENGIMILDKFLPWKELIIESENPKAKLINFAIFPSNRGGYNIYAVPLRLGSFESRKLFPEKWAGLKDEDLQKASGIKTATFCHNKRFICAVETKEDAIKLAKIANEI